MGLLSTVSSGLGALGGLAGNRGDNEFRDVNQRNFNLPGYQQGMQQRGQLANMYGQQGSQFQGQQQGLASLLQAQARGTGPSVANMQMQSGLQQALAQQQALAASGRGNAAQAARQASMNSGNLTANIAGQGAIARMQEMQGAQGLLGNVLGQARSQDINQQQVNNNSQLSALQQQLQLQELQQRGQLEMERQRGNRFQGLTQTPTNQEQGIGMLSSALGGLF